MNLRGFLTTGRILPDILEPEHVPAPPPDLALLRASRRAMATLFEIIFPFGLPQATQAAEAALDLIDDLEDQLTVYRAHSEVSQLNARAFDEDVAVESRLFDLLSLSAHLTRETRGAFDIATGALIKAWGFYKRDGRVPTVAERAAAMGRTGMRHVILNAERRTVRYLRKELEINLGGIGKGYALDRTAQMLREEWGIGSALLHGGTSSVRAIGCPPGQPKGWAVSLRHPWEEERTFGIVYLRDQALGTSAATHQHFKYNGRTLGHLLNPRNGWPAEGHRQVSVVAPTAAEADALSTAFFVMDLEETQRWCQTRPHIGAVILPAGAESEPVVINLTPGSFALPLPRVFPRGS